VVGKAENAMGMRALSTVLISRDGRKISLRNSKMKSGSKTAAQTVTKVNNSARKKSGGPRTALGKTRSKYNARKHGIFSKFVVLEGESQEEFDAMWNGLRQDFLPVGTFEESLVEMLADIWWRQRRVLQAEGAAIQLGREFLEWDERLRQMAEIDNIPPSRHPTGMVRRIANAEALATSLSHLESLRASVARDGLDFERDKLILNSLYGSFSKFPRNDFRISYRHLALTASTPEDIRIQRGYLSPQECKKELLELLDEEILSVMHLQEEREAIESRRVELKSLRENVPTSPGLDQLLRYSTTLDRQFDRTLSQLERAQRMRRGQPVAPRIDVNVSSS
jgi:hypothetical protein